MRTVKNWMDIALRATVLIFTPVLLMLYTIYNSFFEIGLIIHWVFIGLYLLIFLRWTIDKYRHESLEEEIQTFEGLDQLIEQNRWKVIDQSQTKMTVRPIFDVPFNWILNDRISLTYKNGKVKIEGPKHYSTILAKHIRGESSIWTRKNLGAMRFVFVAFLTVLPLLITSNVLWSLSVMRHNARANVSEVIEFPYMAEAGNTPENAMNRGNAVESDNYIFYVEDHLNLVRTSKDFQERDYLYQTETGYSISYLNIVGDWLYYSRGERLERIRLDGTEQETLYDLSYLIDMHIINDSVYFLSLEDDLSVYRMDINGQTLEKLINVSGQSLAVHEDRILVSVGSEQPTRLESYNLDGGDRQVLLEEYARDVMVWDDFYYYIGNNSNLYRTEIGENTDRQLIVDGDVSSYMPTEEGIIYSLHSDQVGFPGSGVYQTNVEGSDHTLLSASDNVEGFAVVDNYVLYTASETFDQLSVRRLDLTSGVIDHLNR